jgi:hypothetical protein
VSAHSASHRRGWLSALVALVSDFVFEPIEETVEPEPQALQPQPVIAVVSAAPRSGATTVARLLAAELASRADGAAIVTSTSPTRRSAPPSRAASRLATALAGVADVQPCGRLCVARLSPATANAVAREGWASQVGRIVNAARYLAPVVLDLPADGSAVTIATTADRIAVVTAATGEPPLLDAVAAIVGDRPVKVVNRLADPMTWAGRADLQLPDSRIAARAAAIGTRPLGSLGAAITELADALEARR